jgi:protein-S-isoprenylcysteine O-methyltransferase Ste14
MRILATLGLLPAGATLYFFVFWHWFDFWRRRQLTTYAMMLGTFGVLGALVYAFRDFVFEHQLVFPRWVNILGWILFVAANLFGFVADRQIGMRVRSFTPFFETNGKIQLKTSGAYAVVRHPIYASGIYFQIAVFLITGYLAVAVAWIIFTLGAIWFTQKEEKRLVTLLDDPAEYQRYRARVPALFPFPR